MKLRSLASLYWIAVVMGVAALPATGHATSRIGLYTDETGSTCSFSGNAPGMVTAYVVIHPDPNGVRALRFSAPLPACFGATFLYDAPPGGAPVTGSSPTGVQIAFPSCAPYPEPTLALTITYYRNGSTTPCCAFPIEPDPSVGTIEVTDCSFNVGTMAPVISHFNADGSCPCADVSPPAPPVNPSPDQGAVNVGLTAPLAWSANPLDIDIASFDVYMGTSASPPFVASVTQATYQPASFFNTSTTYYWRVDVRDTDGNVTTGPPWSFTTVASNSPPATPGLTFPLSGATAVSVTPQMTWTASDPNSDPLKYDVYLGPSPNPVLVASNLTQKSYTPATLAFNTAYSWYVIARDPLGAQTTSATSSFTTRLENYPPDAPTLLSPVNGAAHLPAQVTFQWAGGDPDNNLTAFVFYIGSTNPPPLYATGGTGTSRTINLATGTQYYWQVVARDTYGATTASTIWTLHTNAIPTTPSNPSPANEATNVPFNTTITWQCLDPDDSPTYDVYAGNSPNPPFRGTATSASWDVSSLVISDHDFWWKVVAKDGHSTPITGPLWYFHVKPNSSPNAPYNPTPADNTYSNSSTVTWDASDNDAPPQVLLYDVWFGTTNPPPQVQWQRDQKNYTPPYSLQPGTRYYWQISSWDSYVYTTGPVWSFVAGQPTATSELPTELALGRNHPNPFNPQTIIPYTVPKGAAMHVRIMVFDAAGRRVRTLVDEAQSAGAHEVIWRGENEAGSVVSSGIYYCMMDAGGKRFTQKLVLLK